MPTAKGWLECDKNNEKSRSGIKIPSLIVDRIQLRKNLLVIYATTGGKYVIERVDNSYICLSDYQIDESSQFIIDYLQLLLQLLCLNCQLLFSTQMSFNHVFYLYLHLFLFIFVLTILLHLLVLFFLQLLYLGF